MNRGVPCAAISGYYGCGNAGDEAVLEGIITALRECMPDIRVIVLTADPESTRRLHGGVQTARRYNLSDVIKAIRASDVLISGGGSLLQDASSARSAFYYLGILRTARFLHRKRIIYAQGIGPLYRENVRKAVRNELSKADYISVRDIDSKTLLQQIGVDVSGVELVGDPAFLVKPDLQLADAVLGQFGLAGKPFVCVCLREWNGIEKTLPALTYSLKEFCRSASLSAVALSMQDDQDGEIARQLDVGPVIKCSGDFRLLKGTVARSSMVVAMRLHALIFASSEGVPFLPIVYDPKVSSFSRSVAGREGVLLEDVEKDILITQLNDIYANASLIGGQIKAAADSMASSARTPALKVRHLLYGR